MKKYHNLKLKPTSPVEAGERKRRVGRVSKQASGKASAKPFVAVRSSFSRLQNVLLRPVQIQRPEKVR